MILEDLRLPVLSMKEAGIDPDIEENGSSFEENALIKARAVAACAGPGDIVLADDSGLEIDYLNGEPGIYSARYMGEDTSYRIKNANLIERLSGVPKEQRTARFVCAIAAVLPPCGPDAAVPEGPEAAVPEGPDAAAPEGPGAAAPEGPEAGRTGKTQEFVVRGTVEGYIGWEERGTNGFGYDPIFYVEEYGCSTAELDSETKNRISHRGNALRLCEERLRELL